MRKTVFGVWVLLLVCGAVWADPFINEPIDYWPTQWQLPTGGTIYNPWVTQPPYQRNINYTFDNPSAPLQPVYEGYDDAVLYPSDFVLLGPSWHWYANDVDFQVGGVAKRFGLYGIDNRQGATPIQDNVTIHIDNWNIPRPWKHIWEEIVYLTNANPEGEDYLMVPEGFQVLGPVHVLEGTLPDGYSLDDVAWKAFPNPPWEEILHQLIVPAGGFILVDQMHFATECVPEPATLTLLGSAAVLLVLRRRRKP